MDTDLLVVGAGPFALAMAAHADALGIDHVVLGSPMSFWREHMPAGMRLRSRCDWHLDPAEQDTLDRFLETRGRRAAEVEPLSLDLYLDYAEWFQRAKGIRPRDVRVTRLEAREGGFSADLDDGTQLRARRVLLALGFAPFAHVPEELAREIPAAHSSHSRDCVAPGTFAGQRLLVVGGRQSAFECAALLAEAGARAVHVCHRHATPAFEASDWAWVVPLLERIAREPGWYRGLPASQREALDARFWVEGRSRLEPWLGPRLRREAISIRPHTRIAGCEPGPGGALRVGLDDGSALEVEHVLFATGYRVDLARVPLLSSELRARIACRDGFPILDESLQTSVPGLFVTSLPATRDCGLFFAFTAAVRASARIVGRALTSA